MHIPSRRITSVAFFAVAALLAGCPKPAEQARPEPAPAPAPEPFAGAPAAPTQPPSVAGIPAAAIAAAERAKAKVEVASTATLDNGAIYKQAKQLLADGKPSEALHTLETIQMELLTPAQEKAVADLRAEIERTRTEVDAAAAATADNGAIFKQAKQLLAERKPEDALRALETIQTDRLTPAQAKAVADLRAEIERALAAH